MATNGLVTGLSGRYATALFELAQARGALPAVEASLARVRDALSESADLRQLATSPLIERDAAERAVAGLGAALDLDAVTANFLGVLAKNRRLGQLGNIIRDFRKLTAQHRGETTAQVTSAVLLSDDQRAALADKLRSHLRRDVAMDVTVDPSILGGIIVQIGSRRIDASIKSKLAAYQAAMKG